MSDNPWDNITPTIEWTKETWGALESARLEAIYIWANNPIPVMAADIISNMLMNLVWTVDGERLGELKVIIEEDPRLATEEAEFGKYRLESLLLCYVPDLFNDPWTENFIDYLAQETNAFLFDERVLQSTLRLTIDLHTGALTICALKEHNE